MSKQNDETLYVIHYIDDRGKKWFEGVTNNFDAWLQDVALSSIGFCADDFDVEEVEVSYFKERCGGVL
tara:strand:+ start:1824 stop:2027 length:204 start_codon:yes stop_codon:yes gene_type:complete